MTENRCITIVSAATDNNKNIYSTGRRKKCRKLIRTGLMVTALSAALMVSGCKKKSNIQVFTYQENDDQTITINGLTDKGKTDDKIKVPAKIDGKDVYSIDNEAFRDDQNVTQVVIEEGIKKIGSNTFLNCTNLEQIDFPSSLEEIGTNAVKSSLWGNNVLKDKDEVVINHILIQVKDGIDNYSVPDGVKEIGSGLFYQNSELKEITLSSDLEEIGTFAFAGCTGLLRIELPTSVTKIGYSAFSDCTGLKDIKLNDNIEEIGPEAFKNVSHITTTKSLNGSPWGALSVN